MQSALKFLRLHWWHLLLLPPGAILVTFLHEAAHAIEVIRQGGTITNFVILPSGGNWGFIEFFFPPDVEYSNFTIGMAPYFMWLGFCLLAILISFAKPLRFWQASLVYIWLFVIPLADIANTAFPWYFRTSQNDFYQSLGNSEHLLAPLLIFLAVALSFFGGIWLQIKLYREFRLSLLGYSLLFGVTAIGVFLLSCFTL